jgi:hypothetical protein
VGSFYRTSTLEAVELNLLNHINNLMSWQHEWRIAQSLMCWTDKMRVVPLHHDMQISATGVGRHGGK